MSIREEMLDSGWSPSRSVDIAEDLAALREEGRTAWAGLEDLLREYSGLTFAGHLDQAVVVMGAAAATRQRDARWNDGYDEELGVRLAPVGVYSHLTIYLAEDGQFYGGFDSLYGRLPATLPEVLDGLLNRNPPLPQLDRELVD